MPGVVTGTSGTKATVSLIKDTNCCGGEPLIKQLAENGYSLGNPNAQKPPCMAYSHKQRYLQLMQAKKELRMTCGE